MDTIRIRWAGKRQFTGWNAAGHGIVMDSPPQYRGEGTGPRPVELLLYGLGGCTAMDVVSVLEKKRLDVRGVEMVLTGTQVEDSFPHYYKTIHMDYIVTGVGIPEAAVQRAIELSESKYCSVKGALGPQVTVTWSFRVEEPAPLGSPAPDAE